MLNLFTFLKENLKIENIFQDIKGLIDNSNINDNDKKNLGEFFLFTGINNENLGNLVKANNQFLKFFDSKNKDLYNKINIKINENENKYLFNSNFIYKTFKKITDNSNDNLNIEERKNIDYIVKLNNLCGSIYEKYIYYLVMNSKINNIYNYKNRFLLFMGENYFIIIFSLESKKFLPLISINLFSNLDNFNNFEIEEILNDKIILNDFKNKIIYFIENNDFFYYFCLLKKQFSYNSNFVVDKKYLLFDNIINDELQFSFIDLSNLSKKENNQLTQLLNFKINDNLPKIMLHQNFKQFIALYDNNQLCIVDYIYNEECLNYNNINENISNISELNSIKNSIIIPNIYTFSSVYNNDNKNYGVNNLFFGSYYFCTQSNINEFIEFDFKTEYFFKNCKIKFYKNYYYESRFKKIKIIFLDSEKKIIRTYEIKNENKKDEYFIVNFFNTKGRYIKFEFLENFGEKYFIIDKMEFFIDEIIY